MNNVKQFSLSTLVVSILLATGCTSMTKSGPGVLSNLIDEANNNGVGLESNAINSYPNYLQPYIDKNKRSGSRDQVLINMQAGVEAMKYGDHVITRRLMEDAYNRIETVYANNKAAKAARSNYVEESNKDFKGEPYERAMVGYYLGMADLLNNDLQSAKASFSWGEYQDTLSASEEFQSDMDSLVFLRGWAKHCSGESSSAKEDFEQSHQSVPNQANLLVLVETGGAPVKYTSGEHDEVLKFKAAPDSYASPTTITYNNNRHYLNKLEDLAHQATTRGGREIDAVLAGKASFKDSTNTAANVAAGVGLGALSVANAYAQAGDLDSMRNAGGIGAVFGLFSLASSAISKATTPSADTRQWDNLPHFILAKSLALDINDPLSKVVINGVSVTPQKTGQCYLAWHRVES